ncbi:MAG: hypothetical protein IKC32_07190 [Clostridia bacterium]|nr:hypothetical protein [Clostridia bacterium]
MNKLKGFLYKTAAYTVILLFVLYVSLALAGVTDQGVPIAKFFLIMGYAALITGAGLLVGLLSCRMIYQIILHYSILLSGFIVIYYNSGVVGSSNAAKLFIAISLFTLVYALVRITLYLIRRGKAPAKESGDPGQKKKKAEEPKYTSRFGG